MSERRKRILFVCGSLNQTTQMHQVARELPEHEHAFTPYYCEGALEWCRRAGLLEFTIIGDKLRARCVRYLEEEGLPIDYEGRGAAYDLVVTCSDLVVQRQLRSVPFVLVHEGILDPPTSFLRLCQRYRVLPRWLAGTATTGLSMAYERFCVASEGYRDHFIGLGIPPEKIAVTGIPNFDDCRRYLKNRFPLRGYVLACTSDARETWKRDDRREFLRRCMTLADGKQLVVK